MNKARPGRWQFLVFHHLVLGVLPLFLSFMPEALAQLPGAVATVSVSSTLGPPNDFFSVTGAVAGTIVQLDLDHTITSPFENVQAVGSGKVFGGTVFPSLTASVDGQLDLNHTGIVNARSASLGATLTLKVLAPQIAAPPVPVAVIPMAVDTVGFARFTGSGGASGGASAGITAANTAAATAEDTTVHNTPRQFNTTLLFEASPTFPVTVFMSVNISLTVGPGGHASGQAVVDPYFYFDQATFDAAMGPDTFDLSQYYTLEFSEGFQNAPVVPEPGTAATVMVGLASLGLLLKRRTSNLG